MKKLYNFVVATLTVAAVFLLNLQPQAQTNHTEVSNFMKSLGWHLSPDNDFRSQEHSKVHYYNFDSLHKYAVVAFPRNKAIKTYDLQALYDNGSLFTLAKNTTTVTKPFNKKFNYPVILINPLASTKLGLMVHAEPDDPKYYSQLHYMIFYR
jgi:hypothetical protein